VSYQQMQAPKPPTNPKPPMSRGKKIALWVAVAVCAPVFLAGALAGIKASNPPDTTAVPTDSPAAPATSAAATPKATHAPQVSATDPAIIDAAFVGTVQSDDADLKQYPASELTQSGQQICSDVRGGMAVSDEAQVLTTQYDAKAAGVLLEVAPDAYCKDLKPSIEQQIQALH
jgi:hypothetical protein